MKHAASARPWYTLSMTAGCLPDVVVLQDMLKCCCCLSYRGGLFEGSMVEARWGPAGGLGSASSQAGIQVMGACHIASAAQDGVLFSGVLIAGHGA